jgi:amidohydrolase
VATAALAEELGGRVLVVGSPAEEGGGGKLPLIEGGVLDDADVAMMVHPAGLELTGMTTLAVDQVRVTFRGRAAHAAAAPYAGRNALDAGVLGYMNVAALRQHILPSERIHGVFTRGGDKPNIVPDHVEMQWYVRSGAMTTLAPLKERFTAAMEAGARASGCEIAFDWHGPLYADMVDSEPLIDAYRDNARFLGREPVTPVPGAEVVGSTDMGNVSYRVPSIHPMIKVAPAEVAIHTAAFAEAAASSAADQAVVDGAKALALTVADVWGRPELVPVAREHLESQLHRHV